MVGYTEKVPPRRINRKFSMVVKLMGMWCMLECCIGILF